MKRRIVLLGPPASGKGSQALLIFQKYGIAPVSTGHLLRAEAEAGTDLGHQAASYTSKGQLAPDDLVIAVLKKWLEVGRSDYVFDGFPRTLAQAVLLEPMLAEKEMPLEIVLFLSCSFPIIEQRVLGRVVCVVCKSTFRMSSKQTACPLCGGDLSRRTDDTPEILRQRMAQYEEKTAPLVDFYTRQGLLTEINADCDPKDVFANVEGALVA